MREGGDRYTQTLAVLEQLAHEGRASLHWKREIRMCRCDAWMRGYRPVSKLRTYLHMSAFTLLTSKP